MKAFAIIYSSLVSLAVTFSNGALAALGEPPHQTKKVEIADVLKANINADVQTSNCFFGAGPGENDEINVGLITQLGVASLRYPSESANETWSVDGSDLLYKYGSVAYVKFTFDLNLKFTAAVLHVETNPPLEPNTINCDFKAAL